ncbi:esterase-like activity of phytase family protein [Streptomyces iconiensis]|uniref:Esterase-like activity of phytase family protein n=1 Tax=Streptomyces iconiensis TaxID=1384038 RepID=A0ABT6ZW99_9ACTN|nr:esterase-like activity of phytase family protein [Streptomyces iconiensis]MDJ1133343.1 esterase-like activity of phytase family protein [Streptomyces iconiensis]
MRPRIPLAAATAILALAASAPSSVAAAGTSGPPVVRHGHACSPSVALRGYSDALDKTEYQGHPVTGISALAQDTEGHAAALSDRSVLFSLDVRGNTPRTTGAVALADGNGAPLDSEGLVVERDGQRLVTSEAEPSVRRHARDGTFTGQRLPVPEALRVAPQGRAQHNQTFEGLTAQPGGRVLIASMEGPLTGDGTDASGRQLVRFQTWQRTHGSHGSYGLSRQWGYPVDRALGVAEVAATGDGRLLVLERGYDVEAGANTIRLYLADPRGADDVRSVDRLTGENGTHMVRKTLLADLGDCPDLGAPNPSPQPNPLLDNIEALAVMGHARDGRLRLLLASDDNERAEQVTRLYELTARLPHP